MTRRANTKDPNSAPTPQPDSDATADSGPNPSEAESVLESRDEAQTHRFGMALGALLQGGDVVGLVGDLGSGKTCLVSGVAEGMGVDSEVYVSSPTFTLINEYSGRIPIAHVDFYRLTHEDDLLEIGLEEYYRGQAACLVEWFDRFPSVASLDHLEVRFSVAVDMSRRISLFPRGPRSELLAREWLSACYKPQHAV